mgnify:CR=1 FL=1
MNRDTFTSPRAQKTIADMLRALGQRRMTREQLEAELHLSKASARRYLAHLQAEPRRVFVARWSRTGGNLAPVYALGSRKDAMRPVSPTRRERNVERWQEIKADPAKHHVVLRTARVAAAIRRTRATPQTWMSALIPGPIAMKRKGLAQTEGMR